MKAMRDISKELLGLFVEDWGFALAIGGCIGIVAILSVAHIGSNVYRAIGLFVLLASTLIVSVSRAGNE